jgi:acyl carrier protein
VDKQAILEQVKRSIGDSCGIPEDRIEPSSTLFQDLGINSIDMVDILFSLESTFGVELKISDIEAGCRAEVGDVPFEIDGVITPEGLDVLTRLMPGTRPGTLVAGLTMSDIVDLITVEILCTMVQHKLRQDRR